MSSGESETRSKASFFLKRMLSLLVAIGKAKELAARCKTSTAKTRLLVLGLFRSKKMIFSSIASKMRIHASHEKNDDLLTAAEEKLLAYKLQAEGPSDGQASAQEAPEEREEEEEDVDEKEEDEDEYPDLRHSLFDEEGELCGDDGTGSVIDLVKSTRGEDQGEFVLENEIDHVADLFIRRFHRQMMLQKLESFKRYQDMLKRSS